MLLGNNSDRNKQQSTAEGKIFFSPTFNDEDKVLPAGGSSQKLQLKAPMIMNKTTNSHNDATEETREVKKPVKRSLWRESRNFIANNSRSLTPLARGSRHVRNSNHFDSRKSSDNNLVISQFTSSSAMTSTAPAAVKQTNHVPPQPVINRPASRNCMITYDVFGYTRPLNTSSTSCAKNDPPASRRTN